MILVTPVGKESQPAELLPEEKEAKGSLVPIMNELLLVETIIVAIIHIFFIAFIYTSIN